nr:universal stress protein [Saprospiraceae bacterium]
SADPLVADDFLIGFPSAEISTLAKKLPADLIVMATKAPQSFLKRWLGSTAYEVIAKTLTPVLLIPPKATNKSIKYINIAIEHPKDLDYVLSSISWVKYIPEVVINLIHINENLNGLKKVFDQALEEYKDWNLRFNNIAHTNIVEALVNLAENDDNDLLVVYHKDKAWLDSLLHKSVSKQVLGQINAPLLIVS